LAENEFIIEVTNLNKRFKNTLAVNNLNLQVLRGDVFGFLGPNGAGKSTTIRILLSLISPNSGSINIFGKSLRRFRKQILEKVGAIVEKPDFYNFLSAYKNLEILAKLSGIEVSSSRIFELLELVGLKDRYKSKVKTYSHGMKQRLGIAQALLHNPELIILDEPTTGLDPFGMKEIRDLIIRLSKEEKKTVFLSSHILSEIEMIADRMIIINKGTSVIQGSVKELLNSGVLKVAFEVDDIIKSKSILEGTSWYNKIEFISGDTLNFSLEQKEIAPLNKLLVEQGINVNAVIPKRSLEEYFLKITSEAN
jgi:ABC-type multidrug transport system ATPase subunit